MIIRPRRQQLPVAETEGDLVDNGKADWERWSMFAPGVK